MTVVAVSLRDLAAVFRAELIAAQEDRAQRDDFVTVCGETELGWVFHERRVMHRETNWARTAANKPEIPMEAIIRAERHASGHVDYTLKFAFYCAEIALGCSTIWKSEET